MKTVFWGGSRQKLREACAVAADVDYVNDKEFYYSKPLAKLQGVLGSVDLHIMTQSWPLPLDFIELMLSSERKQRPTGAALLEKCRLTGSGYSCLGPGAFKTYEAYGSAHHPDSAHPYQRSSVAGYGPSAYSFSAWS